MVAWLLVADAVAVELLLLACFALLCFNEHTRSRTSCQHSAHAQRMIGTPAHARHVSAAHMPCAHKHTRSRASCQHCAHARQVISTPAHARHVSAAEMPANAKHTRSRLSCQHCAHARN